MAKTKEPNTLADNRKAFHDYFIIESYEAGIELKGTEVKSIRNGRANLKDSYGEIRNGELFVRNMHISPYEQGNIFNVNPLRERKLLLHKAEINKLNGFLTQQGYSLVPLSLYLKKGRVKVNIAVVKGKKNYDKREAMLERTVKREIEKEFKDKMRY
ncbi:SsrA-binding protein SmpB [Clostridium cellulovorans]|uniref:SsrA-binding protein n=1 Tax=Clostridium cellulovorans (strain ATCC 35296 / DSM 3052 / OCM 3 / 743B) TaxID=573061 RepID=D9SRZ0_CLOC7|nr:SsrA-binding protein SmpB [Clostridium cellulovorans]ADL50507.1 SsrA-binding protein [Clostridium cellulovorans 743B]